MKNKFLILACVLILGNFTPTFFIHADTGQTGSGGTTNQTGCSGNTGQTPSVDVSQSYASGDATHTTVLYKALLNGNPGDTCYTYTWTRVDSGLNSVIRTSNNPNESITYTSVTGTYKIKLDVANSAGTNVGTKTVSSDLALLRSQGTGGGTNSGSGQSSSGDCTFDQNGTRLCNPLGGGESTIIDIIIKLLKAFMEIIAIVAVAMVVFGGFRMVISAGNESEIKNAKKTITYAILGLVIAILSYSIVAIVENLLQGTVK